MLGITRRQTRPVVRRCDARRLTPTISQCHIMVRHRSHPCTIKLTCTMTYMCIILCYVCETQPAALPVTVDNSIIIIYNKRGLSPNIVFAHSTPRHITLIIMTFTPGRGPSLAHDIIDMQTSGLPTLGCT